MKQKLFSITKKDLKIDTYRGSGPGGQHKNKTSSCVRITHPPSGAVVSCCENRCQHKNKKAAFLKLKDDSKFNSWVKLVASGAIQKVEEAMQEHNLLTEGWDGEEWYELP